MTSPVSKDEVIEADLASEQFVHVDLVRVQRAEKNLGRKRK